ncbi:hypothetical protein [Salibacter halophilus]|uniref:OprD family porin n=1 Tax=Salibacter halophilus TaxID=1803916 RepID=A0A6N6M823_9FLAO|nr:hypothetical protein [Salibacter halophilus]KAB1064798.1 hypothetical protein F3059_05425 [Salibacter halophilus]
MSLKEIYSQKLLFFYVFFLLITPLETHANSQSDSTDIENLSEFFSKGKFNGQIRNYFMATVHHSTLPNYWTNATGGSLKFQTAKFHGFSLGVTGNIAFKTFSSELYNDSSPQLSAKWESELYDLNETNFDKTHTRFDELYLSYEQENIRVTIGSQNIDQEPLLQQLDGRMMPFVYQGIWSEYQHAKGKSFLGVINGIGSRGMTNWYSLNDGIGIIGRGLQPDGTISNYRKKSDTRALVVAGHQHKIGKKWSVNLWTNWLDRIYGIHWLEGHYENENILAGVQYVFQHALPKQEQLDYNHRYYQPGENANIIAAKLGTKLSNWLLTGNYLHTFEGGRFLYPRELGRDNFFTSEPRSWQDGFGNSDVMKLKANYRINNSKYGDINAGFAYNRIFSVSQKDLENNKYAIPPYSQLTSDIQYSFNGMLKGLDLRFIYIYRISDENITIPEKNMFYRTYFSHYNLIVNVNF